MNVKKTLDTKSLLPKEEMLEVKPGFKSLEIGIPKESSFQENRVSLTPDSVGVLVANGHSVIIEKGAGLSANFNDDEYISKGAHIASSNNEVFKAKYILKIEPPTKDELSLMSDSQVLISALQMNTRSINFFETLNKKRLTALAFEFIKDQHNKLPFVRIMSEIAGNTSMLIAGEYLSTANNGKGLMLGGVSGLIPTSVVIIGAGTVGEYACRTALGLGSSVVVFDDSVTKLRRLQNNINSRISTSTMQPKVLSKALKRADVVIAALQIGNGRVPCVVSDHMVQSMKSGSIVIDVSIDQGGCFETSEVTSHKKPVFVKHDVIHYCVPNIASRVARTASLSISNLLTPILINIGDLGGIDNAIRKNEFLRSGIYNYNNKHTNKILSKNFKLSYYDLNLLMGE